MGLVGPVDPDSPQGSYLTLITELIDPGRFPHLAKAGPEGLDDDEEDFYVEEFERGLGLLLDGIEALIARSGDRGSPAAAPDQGMPNVRPSRARPPRPARRRPGRRGSA